MRGQWKTFVAMLVLTVLVAGLAGWGGVEIGLHRSASSHDLDTTLHQDLDLTAAQDEKIRSLEAGFAGEKERLQTEMHAANRDLARAITHSHDYGSDAQDAIGRYHRAMAELQERTVQHVLAMRRVLAPQQAAIFDKTIAHALSADAS